MHATARCAGAPPLGSGPEMMGLKPATTTGTDARAPLLGQPFVAGNVAFVQNLSVAGIKGLKHLQVKLFECEWRGTPGMVGKFSLCCPSPWMLEGCLPQYNIFFVRA